MAETADQPLDVTRCLGALAQGRPEAAADLLPVVYVELKRLAENAFRSQAPSHTLQPTALVHQAFLKLFDGRQLAVSDRTHFFALAARVMRQLLVDHARAKGRDKRGAKAQADSLGDALASAAGIDCDVLDLEEALSELAEIEPRQARVVELRFFGGLEVDEAAHVLAVSISSVERDWRFARAWLGRRLGSAS